MVDTARPDFADSWRLRTGLALGFVFDIMAMAGRDDFTAKVPIDPPTRHLRHSVTMTSYSWAVSSATAETSRDVDSMAAIRLVLGVARLGEADLAGWWSSQGLNSAVEFALAGFRRTSLIVGAELALLSAIRRHEQVLPRQNAVHLFSSHLPFSHWTRAHLAELKSTGASELVDELRAWTTVEQADQRLSEWIEASASATDLRSTVTADELAIPETRAALLVHLAAGYLDQSGQLDIPYIDLAT